MLAMRLLFTILMFSCFCAGAQETCSLKWLGIVSDYSGYLFYSGDKINEITIKMVPEGSVCGTVFTEGMKKQPFVKKISSAKSTSDTLTYTLKLKYHPAADEFRKALEPYGLTYININGTRIWLISLATLEEARKRQSEMEISQLQWNPACGDPNMPEYYTYRIWSLKTKLHYMLGGDYAKYLYTGYITQFLDDLENARKDKEDFEKQH